MTKKSIITDKRLLLLLMATFVVALIVYVADYNYTPFWITFKLAFLTTSILLVGSIPISYFISFSKSKSKFLLESIVSLPIVLPPTVLGYYFIVALGPRSSIGRFLEDNLGLSLIFSFEGILLGTIIYCLPFMVYPIVNGFRNLPGSMIESAQLLGKSKRSILWNVIIPNNRGSIASGVLLSFAHTIGEFGVVLMIGGNIPETRVASIAIYDEMNQMNYEAADHLALVLLAFSFILILAIHFIRNSKKKQFA
jgi:molybdate transport system permease protein